MGLDVLAVINNCLQQHLSSRAVLPLCMGLDVGSDKQLFPTAIQLEGLCCLSAGGRIEGDVRINGHPKEQNSFARVSGYVEQFDTHSAAATVHEALMFSGLLRMERDVDHDTTEAFVEQVLRSSPPLIHAKVLIC